MRQISIGSNQIQTTGYKAFIPRPFPPLDLLPFPDTLIMKSSEAARLLGKLDGTIRSLTGIESCVPMFLYKEATSSCRIEGTKATMLDALEAKIQMNSTLPKDVDDIVHYLKATNYGIDRISKEPFPISLQIVRELHYQLINGALRSHFIVPGEFRKGQVWIGGPRPDLAVFVPPPRAIMEKALNCLERFFTSEDFIPVPLKAGLIHAQFELVHPFPDGNGRVGRMLIPLFLCAHGYLEQPVLFLSSYFKKHQRAYYDYLTGYHQGRVFEWVDFFLGGVIESACEAIEIADQIKIIRQNDMSLCQSLGKRSAESSVIVLTHLFAQPMVNVNTIKQWTGFTRDGAYKLITRFIDLGILFPKDIDKKNGQFYIYKNFTNLFSES